MKKLLPVAVLVACAVLPLRGEILEQILVNVNGEILTKTDLETRQVSALRQQQQNRAITAEDLQNDEQLKKALDQVTPDVLLSSVDEMLVMQRGKEMNIHLGDEQFKSILENIRKENKLETEEAFQQALKQEGMTMADLRRSLERQMITSRVQQMEIWNKIAVTEAEAQAYYDEHKSEFTTPATLTLREILVLVADKRPTGSAAGPGVNVGLDDEAREKADRLRIRAAGGEDFAKIAAAESEAASKANGGLIGPINEEELAASLRQLIERMKVGEISEPLRTARGYQILKLETRTQTKVLSFEEARDQISDKVFQQKRQGEMLKYLDKLRAQAVIEWKNEEMKKLYEAALAKRQSAPAAPAPAPES